MSPAKYPRRTIALGSPFDDGTVPPDPATPVTPEAEQLWRGLASVYARSVDNLVRELRKHVPELRLEGIDVMSDAGLVELHRAVETIYATPDRLAGGLDAERLAQALKVADTKRTVQWNAPRVAREYAVLTPSSGLADEKPK